jgi:hypothetical protein
MQQIRISFEQGTPDIEPILRMVVHEIENGLPVQILEIYEANNFEFLAYVWRTSPALCSVDQDVLAHAWDEFLMGRPLPVDTAWVESVK